ncbi:MAG TPA: sigma-70 family RNA polymerase sigma factor [Pyrinomonadaceae bacterium]|nr:sigma-70 family RNA polymerase sigma factor [Pyrinomonadaceae bacterium]
MARDNEEFTMIFNEHYPGLCRFLECMMSGRRDVAQEIVQECFMRLYLMDENELPVTQARFWLYRVARNLALNELSRRQTHHRLSTRISELFRRRTPDPEENLEHEERGRIVLEMLKRLPEQQRAALLLREQEEMSYREIAEVLKITESKVKVDIFRARSAMRSLWNDFVNAPSG